MEFTALYGLPIANHIPRLLGKFSKKILAVNILHFWVFSNVLRLSHCLNNGLALTPPMGWMTWGRYRCITDCDVYPNECISEDLIKSIANELVVGGYADAGYQYVIIDDCWMDKERDYLGRLRPDYSRFPSGIDYLSNYVHNLSLKFGMYENYGTTTCEKFPGSKNHVETDVQTFAEWKIDYLKLDGCFTYPKELDFGYPEFSKQLNKTGRPIVFSCSWPYYQEHIFKLKPNYSEIRKYCNLWRNFHDIANTWDSVKMIINYYEKHHEEMANLAGPGHWNDPDMLMIGNSGLNVGQSKIQFAVWSILAAPLIMSNDLMNIPTEMKNILLNKDIIAVDQDPLGIAGGAYKNIFGDLKIWTRRLIPVMNGFYSYAIAFVNMNSYFEQSISVNITDFGLNYTDGYCIMDLFKSDEIRNITVKENLTVTILPSDVVFYKFRIITQS